MTIFYLEGKAGSLRDYMTSDSLAMGEEDMVLDVLHETLIYFLAAEATCSFPSRHTLHESVGPDFNRSSWFLNTRIIIA